VYGELHVKPPLSAPSNAARAIQRELLTSVSIDGIESGTGVPSPFLTPTTRSLIDPLQPEISRHEAHISFASRAGMSNEVPSPSVTTLANATTPACIEELFQQYRNSKPVGK